ncbi:MAG: hypothetical protein ACYC4S_17970 [Rhodoferax sp.]
MAAQASYQTQNDRPKLGFDTWQAAGSPRLCAGKVIVHLLAGDVNLLAHQLRQVGWGNALRNGLMSMGVMPRFHQEAFEMR